MFRNLQGITLGVLRASLFDYKKKYFTNTKCHQQPKDETKNKFIGFSQW